jgi:hypothetical protein
MAVRLSKAIPVTGREGPQGCETSRVPHFLDNRLTDGGEVVSLMRWPSFTPREIPGTQILVPIFLGVKRRPARKADNLIAICGPIV